MNMIPEEIVNFAESGEVKLKTTKPQEVVFVVHKGSYQKRGSVLKIDIEYRRKGI
jgi:hypothetical protein